MRLIRFEINNIGIFQNYSSNFDEHYNLTDDEEINRTYELRALLDAPNLDRNKDEYEFYFTKEGFIFCKELLKLMTKNNRGYVQIKKVWIDNVRQKIKYKDKHQVAISIK